MAQVMPTASQTSWRSQIVATIVGTSVRQAE
jgi:hypothetical protein